MNRVAATTMLAVFVLCLTWGTTAATADPIMFVHDSSFNLATVDVATGNVSLIGNMGLQMTDIAFSPTGALFGLSFNTFFSINPLTAAVTTIGFHSVPGGNALVFAADGTLYAAGNTSNSLFTINPLNGATTNLGFMGATSGGDLAFNDGNLYLATSSATLHRVNLSNLALSTTVGSFGVSDVFGLATGDNGVLYGVAGTQIFSVNVATGAATNPVNYGGRGLGAAFGQSFFGESGAPVPTVPEPHSLMLVSIGLAVLGGRRLSLRYFRAKAAKH